MPRPGGEADKFGNRFEATWTVGQIIELARGELAGLIAEPFDLEGVGVEFVATLRDGTREFHSVKRQHSSGKWAIAELCRSGNTGRSILGDLVEKLKREPSARARFVSSVSAYNLAELIDRAGRRDSIAELRYDLDANQALRKDFEQFVGDLAGDEARAIDLLRRVRVDTIDERTLRETVEMEIGVAIYRPDGAEFSPADVRRLLVELIWANLGSHISSDHVWNCLRDGGFARKDWSVDTTVCERIKEINRRYVANVEIELINGQRILRREAAEIFAEFDKEDGAKRVLLSASAGLGKSCVLAQLGRKLAESRMPSLVVRLDRHADAHSPSDIGKQLELPRSPAIVLAGIAKGGPCALVIDQLDAVSMTSGRNQHLWETFDSICREVDRIPNMRLAIACRDFDLRHDKRLRSLKNENDKSGFKEVPLPPRASGNLNCDAWLSFRRRL